MYLLLKHYKTHHCRNLIKSLLSGWFNGEHAYLQAHNSSTLGA